MKVWRADRVEVINGNEYIRYFKDNTVKDSVGGSGLGPQRETGPARYDPILPGLSHGWEIELKRDIDNLEKHDLIIKWTTYADNATPTDDETRVKDIKIIDTFEPDFEHYDDDE